MPIINDYKEVYFGQYCNECVHCKKTEEDEPCCYCLSEPVNIHSHKPTRYEENTSKTKRKLFKETTSCKNTITTKLKKL